MKLFLMRHAQAEDDKTKKDFLRNLTDKGARECLKVSDLLLKYYHIDKILVSPANRTMQTFEIIQNKISCKQHDVLDNLYNTTDEEIIKIIAKQNQKDKNLLVISHNPAIFKAALKLVDFESDEYDMLLNYGMPPANVIILDFANMTNWDNIFTEKSSDIKILANLKS